MESPRYSLSRAKKNTLLELQSESAAAFHCSTVEMSSTDLFIAWYSEATILEPRALSTPSKLVPQTITPGGSLPPTLRELGCF